MVQAIPAGYAGVTPYLLVRDAARMIDFYKKAFGATEVLRLPAPGGKIGHAEIKIGEGIVMLADESPEMGHKSPQTIGGTPITLMFYVPDVDAQFGKAMAAGYPVACIAGKRALMEQVANGTVMHAGTYNANVACVAASARTLLIGERTARRVGPNGSATSGRRSNVNWSEQVSIVRHALRARNAPHLSHGDSYIRNVSSGPFGVCKSAPVRKACDSHPRAACPSLPWEPKRCQPPSATLMRFVSPA